LAGHVDSFQPHFGTCVRHILPTGGPVHRYLSGRQRRNRFGALSPPHLVAMSNFSRASRLNWSMHPSQSSRCRSRVSHIAGEHSPSISVHRRTRTTAHVGTARGFSGWRSVISRHPGRRHPARSAPCARCVRAPSWGTVPWERGSQDDRPGTPRAVLP
jgi:hypothetical protein